MTARGGTDRSFIVDGLLARDPSLAASLLESLPVPVCLVTPDAALSFYNRAFSELFHFDKENGMLSDAIGQGNCPLVRQACEQAVEAGPQTIELAEIKQGIGVSVLRVTCVNAGDHGTFIHFENVSDKVQSRRGLQQMSEERLRHLADATPAILWMTRPDGHCTFFSRGWYDFTGQDETNALGLGWVESIHPEDQDYARQTFREANAKQEPLSFDYRLRRADGEYRWVTDSGRPLYDVQGRFLGYVGSLVDIHDRKLVENALKEANEQLRLALRAGNMGTWQSLDGSEMATIDGAEALLLGLPPDTREIPNSLFRQMIHPDDRTHQSEKIRVALEECADYVAEFRVVLPNGDERWLHSQGKPLLNAQGEVYGMVGINMDVTERKEQEEYVWRLNETLERRVAERTEELHVANEDMTSFTYSVSHDLRAPLRAIIATSRMLLEDHRATLSDNAVRMLERQAYNANRMGDLIDDLLQMARVGRQHITKVSVDLSALALEAEHSLRATTECIVDVEIQPEIRVTADPTLMRLVMQNLLDNACKYSPKGGHVRVSARVEGNETVCCVSDEGIGFDPEYKARLFMPFERLHRAEEFSGTGIGLANVARAIERHGGRVWAHSEGEGKGASFYFSLPS
jgi:PAS domain S-box-containing protein